MSRTKIAATALLAGLPLIAVGATTGAATAATPGGGPQAKISANVSDRTPASGQEFSVSGTFTTGGQPSGEQVVKVQAKQQNGRWKTLPGAKETTNSKGAYKIEVILNAKGQRNLRVVGVGLDTLPNGYQPFSVRVH